MIHLLHSGHRVIVFRATTHVKATGAGNCRQHGFVVSIDSLLNVCIQLKLILTVLRLNILCIVLPPPQALFSGWSAGNSSSIIFKKLSNVNRNILTIMVGYTI